MQKRFNESFKHLLAYVRFTNEYLSVADNVAMKVKFRKTFDSKGNNPVYHLNGWYIRNPKEKV